MIVALSYALSDLGENHIYLVFPCDRISMKPIIDDTLKSFLNDINSSQSVLGARQLTYLMRTNQCLINTKEQSRGI